MDVLTLTSEAANARLRKKRVNLSSIARFCDFMSWQRFSQILTLAVSVTFPPYVRPGDANGRRGRSLR